MGLLTRLGLLVAHSLPLTAPLMARREPGTRVLPTIAVPGIDHGCSPSSCLFQLAFAKLRVVERMPWRKRAEREVHDSQKLDFVPLPIFLASLVHLAEASWPSCLVPVGTI